MASLWRKFLLLGWLFYVLFACVAVFLSGFLLNRDVFADRAACVNKSSARYVDELNSQICVYTKSKVVLLIIDALMFDFAEYDPDNKQPLAYQNKMPVFRDLLKAKPKNSRLFKFIADPPTTTMQRLKGLTTGSLPTFIDAGSNFASSEINEDNFLDQISRSSKSAIFIGDDTWTSLYPGRFLREFPYPSFNVWDLDTVDQGVVKHMEPQLKKQDWDLIIGHFLGVDHCGHRYGPDHPEMTRKLTEMDGFVRNLVNKLDGETTLIVIGDHGMTSTGNHGGDSTAEVTAAMFVFNPHTSLFPPSGKSVSQVMQVDLVPTLSTILGIPIPFSNLGTVISEALPLNETNWQSVFTALLNNVNQVHKYITAYSNKGTQFSDESMAHLSKKHMDLVMRATKVKNLTDFYSFQMDARLYLKSVKTMCEEVWVQFGLVAMLAGCGFMVIGIITIFLSVQSIPILKSFNFAASKYFKIVLAIVTGKSIFGWLFFGAFFEFSCFTSLMFITFFVYMNFHETKGYLRSINSFRDFGWSNYFLIGTMLVSIFGLGSDNFVVEEGFAVSILSAALVLALCLNWTDDKKKLYFGFMSYERLILVALIAMYLILIRSFPSYWQCREEQSWCQFIPSSPLSSNHPYKEVAFTPLIFLTLPLLATWYWLKKSGNLVAPSITANVITYLPILTTILIIIYWVIEALPATLLKKTIHWDIQLLPQICYFFITICLLCLFFDPLLVHIVSSKKRDLQQHADSDVKNLVPYLFHQVKNALNKNAQGGKDICAVYGLPTVFTALLLLTGLLLFQLLSLLQGSKTAPALAIMFFASLLLLLIIGVARLNSIVMPGQLLYVPWFSIISWAIFSVVCFYGTGHNATFPGIQWQAAFVGTDGQFSSNFIPGLMVIASTFSAQIWLGVTLPLLLVTPLTILSFRPSLCPRQDVKVKAANGEMFAYEKSSLTEQSLFMLCTKYILILALRTCASVATAFILRRHLMVWKVFAPKLIFEVVSLLVSMAAVLIGFLLFSRVCKKLEKLMAYLEEKQSV